MGKKTLVIIDGHYYAYRYFFGMPQLSGPDGQPTGVTFGFAKLFRDLFADPDVTHFVLTFDHKDPTFRHIMYPEYKAHRDPMPDNLRSQIPDVFRLAEECGVPLLSIPGYEADDVIATLAQSAEQEGIYSRICSKDKDLDQFLNNYIAKWDPGKNEYVTRDSLLDDKGIRPDQVVDYLCMVGDSADNVPGIKGIGPKTATKLLLAYDSLENVLKNTDKLKGKQKENVEAFIPLAELTHKLITIVTVPDLPETESFVCPECLPESARPLFEELGFNPARFFPRNESLASDNADYTILTEETLPSFLDSLRTIGRFAIDTETTSLNPLEADLVGISFACGAGAKRKDAAYLPLAGLPSAGHKALEWSAVRDTLKPLLEDPDVKKVAQNAKYDLRVFLRNGINMQGLDGDSMLASWVLDPSRTSHGLDALTEEFLQEKKIATGDVVNFASGQTMADVSIESVAQYACEDAQCTWRLTELLEDKLTQQGMLKVYQEQEVPLASCLAHMEQTGFAVNAQILMDSKEHLEHYLDQIFADIRAIAGEKFNPASPKQVAVLLFEKLGLRVIRKTKSGPSTDARVLEALKHDHEMPGLLLQYRSLSKLLSSYLRTLPDHIEKNTGRIHSSFNQHGAETGRLSSDHPNLQNIPKKGDLGREIRAAFMAPADHTLLAADYSQIELRMLAHLSDDETLRQAFDNNADIHRFVAAQVHGCDEASVTPEMRNSAKAINFGIIYGLSSFGLSQQIGISRPAAQEFIDGYFARFSGIRRYIDSVIEEAKECGYVSTIAGRRRYVPLLKSGNGNERKQGERIALNSTIQGSAADLIKKAMLRCSDMLPEQSKLIVQIHDELIVECHNSVIDEASAALQNAMLHALELSVPLLADVRHGSDWLSVS